MAKTLPLTLIGETKILWSKKYLKNIANISSNEMLRLSLQLKSFEWYYAVLVFIDSIDYESVLVNINGNHYNIFIKLSRGKSGNS